LLRLQAKLALVTGGSDGIGLAIAEALLREGAELCIVGRNPDKLARARDQLVFRPGNSLTKSREFLEDGVSGVSLHEGL
jgi:NAD(P)-dependent dehydrogenase (short-subunit alcohol dehydrogenase family)